jgi:5-dehydro-2-deoxygluconokinase
VDVLTVGRVGVDLYPEQTGPLADVRTFGKFLGGTATNVAVAAARLGRSSAVLTKVGDDGFGTYVRNALTGFGVDPSFVGTHPTLRTPVVFCALDPPEDPPLLFYREPTAPDLTIAVGELPLDAIRDAGVFWVTGTGFSAEPSAAAHVEALRVRARREHTVLDLDYRPMFWESPDAARDALEPVLEQVTVVVGNRAEVEVAVGTADPDAAADRLLERGVTLALVKKGAEGVLVASAASRATVPPVSVRVVCGLGAGDAFGGALCHGLLAGWVPARIAAYANAAGAIVASRLACADAMPTDDEIRAQFEGVR